MVRLPFLSLICFALYACSHSQVVRKPAAPTAHSGPDLERELGQPCLSGGPIVLRQAGSGRWEATRGSGPCSPAREAADREEAFRIFLKLNVARTEDLSGDLEVPGPRELELFHRFALSEGGAIWFRYLTNETIGLINKGYYSLRSPSSPGARISELLTGELSEEGAFDPSFVPFRVYAFRGMGARAASGFVAVGIGGFRARFPFSGQVVDPLAILSHEFGHTRFGDPSSGETIEGEARTVVRFENPVRRRNGFAERLYYCDSGRGALIQVNTLEVKPSRCVTGE